MDEREIDGDGETEIGHARWLDGPDTEGDVGVVEGDVGVVEGDVVVAR